MTSIHHEQLYIDGKWVTPDGPGRLSVVNSATEQEMGSIPDGSPLDADRAVEAARAAFVAWSRTPATERARYLSAIADGLQDRSKQLAELMAQEVGMPLKLSQLIQVGLPIGTFRSMAELAANYSFEEPLGTSLLVKEAAGVVVAITPWNYPLHQIAAKVAPALAAGCTVVLKPSEVAPLNAFVLAEIIDEVGLPAGVFNLVTGVGPVVGEQLAAHREVDMVSFTGSTRAGRRVQELAAPTVKRVTLELGGKSPNVILDDADLTKAIPNAVRKAFSNSGQTCSALTRLVVPRDKLAEVEALAQATAEQTAVGDPLGEQPVSLGPLVSEVQRERVRGFIQAGIDEGARLLTGGTEPPEGLETGYYVRPTVFTDVTGEMKIHREEIFGPVLVIEAYDDEDDAVRIANDTDYGLAAGVWSSNPDRATAMARQIRAGQIEINGGAFNPAAPFGGFKQSGNGREYGQLGLEEYLEVKSLQR
jgi:aldehyde dehydrogenase (NAD+)